MDGDPTPFKEFFGKPIFLRFDENTRVIVVEGNVASMKHEFAKKVADEFDMLLVPDIDFNKIYTNEAGVDFTTFNTPLGENVYFNLQNFLMNPNLRNERFFFKSQIQMLRSRLGNYMKALEHMFRTGQGVVIVRSPHSDNLIPAVLRDMNLISKAAYREYMRFYKEVDLCCWLPHMVIHMDASVDFCLDRIKKRENPFELNSPFLNRQFLELYDKHFEFDYLVRNQRFVEYLNFDPADYGDWEMVVELLESFDLLPPEFQSEKGTKFHQWNRLMKKEWNNYFKFTMDKKEMDFLFLEPITDVHIEMLSVPQRNLEGDLLDFHGLSPEDADVYDVTKQRKQMTA
ncbi:hypothetical protein FSP39_015500 [Pinctada imbricata]|uniref:Deoxynucleoside kinase domain-containing protein n=1 Tax=Pinctada imbricata TaxID=66713 RepID=A0AA89CBW6_PINIB|nr:hypothetical protein FSP39_015500 [Pinctada imbricata]